MDVEYVPVEVPPPILKLPLLIVRLPLLMTTLELIVTWLLRVCCAVQVLVELSNATFAARLPVPRVPNTPVERLTAALTRLPLVSVWTGPPAVKFLAVMLP